MSPKGGLDDPFLAFLDHKGWVCILADGLVRV
jgi:hypothetical protein